MMNRWPGRFPLIGVLVLAGAALPACSMRHATNGPIAPRYVAPETAAAPAARLDPDNRLFLDPITLTAAPTD